MNLPPLAALKWPLALVVGATLLAGAGVLWSWNKTHAATAAHGQAQDTLVTAQSRLGRSRQQQQLIAAHLGDYEALVAHGFVGAEDRLGWIEAAQLAGQDAGLTGIEYRLAPRTDAPAALAQGLPLKQTPMTLTLPLLVETDLVHFLVALKQRAPGLHRVGGCTLLRTDDTPFEATNQPRLKAECEIVWYTVAIPPGGAA
jgi:hypothetical protein